MPENRNNRFAAGSEIRRAVLGSAHVDRAKAAETEFDADFQYYITEAAWGDIWSRPELDRRTRSLITVAMLAALRLHGELATHIRACQNTGATRDEIRETLMHVAVYAGVPAANAAIAVAKRVFSDFDSPGVGSVDTVKNDSE
jgi:4-carboxymuconolactone decarboxylase